MRKFVIKTELSKKATAEYLVFHYFIIYGVLGMKTYIEQDGNHRKKFLG